MASSVSDVTLLTYAERVQTFQDYWDSHRTTALQLAAIGHVSDRVPLEALDEGSRCVSCGLFIKKELSIKAFEGERGGGRSYKDEFENFTFHKTGCIRLQVRIPLEPQALLPGLYGSRIDDMRSRFERKSAPKIGKQQSQRLFQTSSLFNLPTEIRLEIYSNILPTLDPVTEIVPLNRDSARVITKMGRDKTGPRNTSKPNILRTCRATNEEALDLLYSKTIFKFGSTKVMYLFLRSIGNAGRQLLEAVDIVCGSREDAISFALLASCKKLRSICIRLPRTMILFSRAPLWYIDGVSSLLALSGLQEITFGDCSSDFGCMSDERSDAAIIRRELTRPKGSSGDISFIKPYLRARDVHLAAKHT